MRIQFSLRDGLRVLGIDTEDAIHDDPARALFLSVTGHFEDAEGQVHSRNVYVGLTRDDIETLRRVVDCILDGEPPEIPPLDFVPIRTSRKSRTLISSVRRR